MVYVKVHKFLSRSGNFETRLSAEVRELKISHQGQLKEYKTVAMDSCSADCNSSNIEIGCPNSFGCCFIS